LVIGGPDFSGTTTQIKDMITYLKDNNLRVKDLRGTEIDALFHSEKFSDFNHRYSSLSEFLDDTTVSNGVKSYVLEESNNLMSGRNNKSNLLVASMVRNDCTTYINPNFADVWIMEEPTCRGAGQTCRVIEQNRSKFGDVMDGRSAAMAHQAYRTEEFLRFRQPLRNAGKVIIRSRSEESACYQIFDKNHMKSGISITEYLKLPGHKIAFENPPTDIFVVCGPADWDKDAYLKLKEIRKGRRVLDDHENDAEYQLLVNQRYASNWIEQLYSKASMCYGSFEPNIVKFDIYNDILKTRELMNQALQKILPNGLLENIVK
jgi:thymidylate kinase